MLRRSFLKIAACCFLHPALDWTRSSRLDEFIERKNLEKAAPTIQQQEVYWFEIRDGDVWLIRNPNVLAAGMPVPKHLCERKLSAYELQQAGWNHDTAPIRPEGWTPDP